MAKIFDFQLSLTTNNSAAPDQLRFEIDNDQAITADLAVAWDAITCTTDFVRITFAVSLDEEGVAALEEIIRTHSGAGMILPSQLPPCPVTAMPPEGSSSLGDSLLVTGAAQGAGPAWFDGELWRWYADGAPVTP